MSDEQRPYLDGPTLRAGLLKWMRDLNAKNAALEAENAALWEIARQVASSEATRGNAVCEYCGSTRGSTYDPRRGMTIADDYAHLPTCPVTRARALLAQHGEEHSA